jgi:hypothetical protein
MDAVTYPNDKIKTFIQENLIAVKLPYDGQPLAGQFKVTWTPTFIILDQDGQEHHRGVGFEPPEEFIPFLLLGMAKINFDKEDYPKAIALLEQITGTYPQSAVAAESVYLLGVSRFKTTHQTQYLKQVYETLKAKYPNSEWVKRAEPYSLLPNQ